MKAIFHALFPFLLAASLVAAAEDVTPETVVATINGRQVTAAEIEDALSGEPPALQQSMRGSLRDFLQQYALTNTLVAMAEDDGLDETSPYREQLAWNRTQTLLQAMISERNKELADKAVNAAELERTMTAWLNQVRQNAAPTDYNEAYFGTPFEELANLPPETVLATLKSGPLTVGEIRDVLTGASAQQQEAFRSQPREFLGQYAMMVALARMADEANLAEKSPYRQQLGWVRSQILMQAKLNSYNDSISVDTAAQKEFYAANLARYTEADVKVLYISFAASAGRTRSDGTPVPTEAEARVTIESLRRQLDEGADFVELVHQYSEDANSREKDGDFGVIHQTDAVPDAIKQVIFSLEAGEVSQPIRQPNGFYLFRVEKTGTLPLEDVLQQLMRDAKAARFQEWFDSVRNSIDITYERPDYFDAN